MFKEIKKTILTWLYDCTHRSLFPMVDIVTKPRCSCNDTFFFSGVDMKVSLDDNRIGTAQGVSINGLKGTITFIGTPGDIEQFLNKEAVLTIVGAMCCEVHPDKTEIKTLLKENIKIYPYYNFAVSIDDNVSEVSLQFDLLKEL